MSSKIIRSRAPLRLGVAGGGTDVRQADGSVVTDARGRWYKMGVGAPIDTWDTI